MAPISNKFSNFFILKQMKLQSVHAFITSQFVRRIGQFVTLYDHFTLIRAVMLIQAMCH
jgi:hypothetical protein